MCALWSGWVGPEVLLHANEMRTDALGMMTGHGRPGVDRIGVDVKAEMAGQAGSSPIAYNYRDIRVKLSSLIR